MRRSISLEDQNCAVHRRRRPDVAGQAPSVNAPRRPGSVPALLLAALLLPGLAACGKGDAALPRLPSATNREERIGPYPRSQFYIHRDLFLAADEPATVPADKADFLRDDDEVLGLVIREKARAYAVTMLSYHHVVNDVVAGIPVAVTY